MNSKERFCALAYRRISGAPSSVCLIGIPFSAEHNSAVGETVNTQWVAESDYLAEPYKGSDACVTRDGQMAAVLTTFEGTDLKV
jgi:hypothetical protein